MSEDNNIVGVSKTSSPGKGNEKDVAMAPGAASDNSTVSDILKAVQDLGSRYDNVESTLARINITVGSHSQKLANVNFTLEEMDDRMRGLEIENDLMKKELQKMKAKEGQMEEQLFELHQKVNITFKKTNDIEQYSRRENLRIYGVAEISLDAEGNKIEETNERCTKKILRILNGQLKLPRVVNETDLAAVHRIGKFDAKNPNSRSIILRFVSRKVRDMVFDAKSCLKGTRWLITEDLTPFQYKLLMKTKNDTEICNKAWTKYGKVQMLTHSGKYVQIDGPSDLLDPAMRSTWGQNRKRNASDLMLSPENGSNSPEYVIAQEADKKNEESGQTVAKVNTNHTDTEQNMETQQALAGIKSNASEIEKQGLGSNEGATFKHPHPVEEKRQPVPGKQVVDDHLSFAETATPKLRNYKKMRGSKNGKFGRGRPRFNTNPPMPNKEGLYNYFQNLDSDDSESKESTISKDSRIDFD